MDWERNKWREGCDCRRQPHATAHRVGVDLVTAHVQSLRSLVFTSTVVPDSYKYRYSAQICSLTAVSTATSTRSTTACHNSDTLEKTHCARSPPKTSRKRITWFVTTNDSDRSVDLRDTVYDMSPAHVQKLPELPSPPHSRTRREQLDLNMQPTYSGIVDAQLKPMMRERGMSLQGHRKTAHYIRALQLNNAADLKIYQEWKDQMQPILTARSFRD